MNEKQRDQLKFLAEELEKQIEKTLLKKAFKGNNAKAT
jgi:hypothetical protein